MCCHRDGSREQHFSASIAGFVLAEEAADAALLYFVVLSLFSALAPLRRSDLEREAEPREPRAQPAPTMG